MTGSFLPWNLRADADDDARLVAERAAGPAGTAVGLARAAGIMLRSVRALDDPGRAVPFAIPCSPLNGAVGRRRLVVLRRVPLEELGDLMGDELLALERAVGGPADIAEDVTAPV